MAADFYRSMMELQQERFHRLLPVNPAEAGTVAYNIAGQLKAEERFEECLDWYDCALDLQPRYASRPYWHRERAGAMYLLERYEDAAATYSVAGELGDDEPTLPLLQGDAFTGSGRYSEAESSFTEAQSLPGRLGAEARLLLWAIKEIIAVRGREPQDRLPAEAAALLQNDQIDWRQVVDVDAACPGAWVQRALEEGADFLVVAAALARYDAGAWALALIACATEGQEAIGLDCAAVANLGSAILSAIEFARTSNLELDEDGRELGQKALDQVLTWFDSVPIDQERLNTLRIHVGDGDGTVIIGFRP